jgi:hypothetical protein
MRTSSGRANRRALGLKTRLPGLLLNEPVGETTAGMICVSPRCYLVMTGRLQVKQQKGRPLGTAPVSPHGAGQPPNQPAGLGRGRFRAATHVHGLGHGHGPGLKQGSQSPIPTFGTMVGRPAGNGTSAALNERGVIVLPPSPLMRRRA